MARLIALYHPPEDPLAFDAYYGPKHIPLAQKIPGVRAAEFSTGPVMMADGTVPYHLVGTLTFDSMADLQAGLESPEGQVALADLENFATGGVTVLLFDSVMPWSMVGVGG